MIQLPPGPAIPVLSDAQNGATAAVAAGQILQVRLSTRPDTGYAWQVVQGPPAIAILRQGYGPAPGPYLKVRSGRLGQQVFDVRAPATPGRTAPLAFAYKPVGRRMAFARVWRVRLSVGPGVASLSPSRR